MESRRLRTIIPNTFRARNHTDPLTVLYGEGKTYTRVSHTYHVCSSEAGKNTGRKKKKKKCQRAINLQPCSCHNPSPPPSKVSSHPSLLPAPLFLRSLSFLFVDNTDWVTRCWAHTGSHTLKGGQVQKLKKIYRVTPTLLDDTRCWRRLHAHTFSGKQAIF